LVNNQARWFLLPFMKQPRAMAAHPGWHVAVVTTFVGGAESIDMIEETVRALRAMAYPHDTWVLDESDDAGVKRVCQQLGAYHFSRKHLPHYQTAEGLFQSASKHGNYNAWLYETGFDRYDIISAFDPDHIPDRAFLTQVLGYFTDRRVGYVQVAQAYYNQHASFIARGAAEETYAYYSSVQMASYGLGYPIVTGCHNTHRVSALKEVDGFAPHDADDLLITQLYRSRGWQGVYVPKILARGLTPVDWNGYLGQQRRWARSVLDLKIRPYTKLSRRVPWKTRAMSFLHGLNYIHKSVLIPVGLVLMAVVLATGSAQNLLTWEFLSRVSLLAVTLQLCELYRQRFYLDWPREWGSHWRAGLLQMAKWPYLLQALWDVALDRRLAYALTAKVRQASRPAVMMWPQLVVVMVISLAWMVGTLSGNLVNPWLHICAGAVVIPSLILMMTERWTYPAPYTRGGTDVHDSFPRPPHLVDEHSLSAEES
ncbi:MAG: glycosyltransferase, partial [Nitrospiraceae bacterium]